MVKRIIELPSFIEGWDWNKVYSRWQSELMRLDASITMPFFTELPLYIPDFNLKMVEDTPDSKMVELYWCRPGEILPFHVLRQAVYDRSGFSGLYMQNIETYGEGPKYTLHYLWQVKDDVEKIAAVLFCASLFPLLESSRSYRDENWPKFICLVKLQEWSERAWGSHSPWPRACTDVLPFSRQPREPINTMDQLIHWLAIDHAFLLTKYIPLALVHGTQRDPVVDAFIKGKKDEARKKHELWQSQQAERERIQHEEVKELQKKHPRYSEWEKVRKEELEQLVWAKPSTAIALDFGVSDVAVAKKCKAMGISKPPRGYWAKILTQSSPDDK